MSNRTTKKFLSSTQPSDILQLTFDLIPQDAPNNGFLPFPKEPDTIMVESVVEEATASFERERLYELYASKISVNHTLDRALISNQANKKLPFYGWFKYKEGFSEPFVHYILQHILDKSSPGVLLDPFSGSGSALFAASVKGWKTEGIELLPVGIYATSARFIAEKVDPGIFYNVVEEVLSLNFADYYDQENQLKHIAITDGAFPLEEEKNLVGYISYCKRYIKDENIKNLLLYTAFCILEEISYTRKDGQYLRWDARSGRREGKNTFNKGYIYSFREAIGKKLQQVLKDLQDKPVQNSLLQGEELLKKGISLPKLHEGSCLTILPALKQNSIDAVLTSPPYANRYDYTRTYALELVYLGCDDAKVKQLRQDMLSCTVENKDKREKLKQYYEGLGRSEEFKVIDQTFNEQRALQEVLLILKRYAKTKRLNNPGIATMVHNYFYEMCFVIYELARVLKEGGTVVMVNDNVRYAGEEVPVDIILSDIAEKFGLATKYIWTLSRGKGNSSQQMGNHGRTELRKCIYIWEKEATNLTYCGSEVDPLS